MTLENELMKVFISEKYPPSLFIIHYNKHSINGTDYIEIIIGHQSNPYPYPEMHDIVYLLYSLSNYTFTKREINMEFEAFVRKHKIKELNL